MFGRLLLVLKASTNVSRKFHERRWTEFLHAWSCCVEQLTSRFCGHM